MECFYHQSQRAIARCNVCGKHLCRVCASKHSPCMCEDCFKKAEELERIEVKAEQKRDRSYRRRNALNVTTGNMLSSCGVGLIVGIIGVCIHLYMHYGEIRIPEGKIVETLVIGFIFFCMSFGWRVMTYLEQWVPVILVSGYLIVLYLAFKTVVSVVIGIPVFLIWLVIYAVRLVGSMFTA